MLLQLRYRANGLVAHCDKCTEMLLKHSNLSLVGLQYWLQLADGHRNALAMTLNGADRLLRSG
ncbi:hypothetical protein D3C79_863060 [compost metagenome]